MRVITRQTLADGVAKRWAVQYSPRSRAEGMQSKLAIGKALKELGEHPDPDVVDDLIGNNSWTILPGCSECEAANNPFVIEVGKEVEYVYTVSYLCSDCASDAYALCVDALLAKE